MDVHDEQLQRAVTGECLALADVLEPLGDDGWDTPSLCEGWRLREVIAHLTMPARYSEEAFMEELRRRGFDFTLLSNELAAQDAQLPPASLVANLRSETLHVWTPPGGGRGGALNHVVIHGLDVTVPLGSRRHPPELTIRAVLDDLSGGGGHAHFGVEIAGRRLEATDMDWSFGSGRPLRGPAEHLALAMCGRRLPDGGVEGEPL